MKFLLRYSNAVKQFHFIAIDLFIDSYLIITAQKVLTYVSSETVNSQYRKQMFRAWTA
jgi:hypothetical protein